MEQIVEIVAVACELPASSGRQSRTGRRELASEVVKRGIVASISLGCGAFFKRKPPPTPSPPLLAQSQIEDRSAFKQQVNAVCQLYLAPELAARGTHVMSCDEMTGIQALERAYPTHAMTCGQVERQEFEYIRHGRLSLIVSWDVATGQVRVLSGPPAMKTLPTTLLT